MKCRKCKVECKVFIYKNGQMGICPVCDNFVFEGYVNMSEILAAIDEDKRSKSCVN